MQTNTYGDLERVIYKYFDEYSPPIVNFLAFCEREAENTNFDSVTFYFLPSDIFDRFPFVLLFFLRGQNVTQRVIQESNTLSTMAKIIGRLPSVVPSSYLKSTSQSFCKDGQSVGFYEYCFSVMSDELKDIVVRGRYRNPRLSTCIHDSSDSLPLN